MGKNRRRALHADFFSSQWSIRRPVARSCIYTPFVRRCFDSFGSASGCIYHTFEMNVLMKMAKLLNIFRQRTQWDSLLMENYAKWSDYRYNNICIIIFFFVLSRKLFYKPAEFCSINLDNFLMNGYKSDIIYDLWVILCFVVYRITSNTQRKIKKKSIAFVACIKEFQTEKKNNDQRGSHD